MQRNWEPAPARRERMIEWIQRHLRRLRSFGLEVYTLHMDRDGVASEKGLRSLYHPKNGLIEVSAAAMSPGIDYSRFTAAQRHAFFIIGGYLLTGGEHGDSKTRSRHPRAHRASMTPDELIQQDTDGHYSALHHVLAQFANERMDAGHGKNWESDARKSAGSAYVPRWAPLALINWKADSRSAKLAETLKTELIDSLGTDLKIGPGSQEGTAERRPEEWRKWNTSTGTLETRPHEDGLSCRKTSVMSNTKHELLLPISEEQIERWLHVMKIQDAMPNLEPQEREFLMSGITDAEWNESMELLI